MHRDPGVSMIYLDGRESSYAMFWRLREELIKLSKFEEQIDGQIIVRKNSKKIQNRRKKNTYFSRQRSRSLRI